MASPDPKDIESIVELFNKSDWGEMHLKTDELEIFLSNDPTATGPSPAGDAPHRERGHWRPGDRAVLLLREPTTTDGS